MEFYSEIEHKLKKKKMKASRIRRYDVEIYKHSQKLNKEANIALKKLMEKKKKKDPNFSLSSKKKEKEEEKEFFSNGTQKFDISKF